MEAEADGCKHTGTPQPFLSSGGGGGGSLRDCLCSQVTAPRLKAVAAIPLAAELPLQGGTERYKGKAVVILRGSVNFITKHDHAKAVGAAAVIFVNLEQVSTHAPSSPPPITQLDF